MINYFQPYACEAFDHMTHEFTNIKFFQPSPDKAPWHVQAILEMGPTEEPIVLNFWPHKNKGQRQPMPAVEGLDDIRAMIVEAVADVAAGPVDLIEGFDE